MKAIASRAARAVLRPLFVPLRTVSRWAAGTVPLDLNPEPALWDDRSRGRGTMLMVLTGHKPALWPYVFPRIAAHVDPDAVDVCVVVSGGAPAAAEARQLAAQRGWSFLQAHEDLLAHTQNLAVARFPEAEWIAKIDEDMFVTPGWLEQTRRAHEQAEAEGRFRVGFAAPTIPVNGFGYRLFLELAGKLDDYRAAFPADPAVSAAVGVAAHGSGDAAEWLWRLAQPLDGRAREMARFGGEYSICPHHFSIGAIVLRRTTFDEFGGFAVAPVPGMLGFEEVGLCHWCMDNSHVIVVAHGALVGHFAFGPQWAHMNALLEREPALFG
jgi:hypothetical protein